MFDCVRPFFVLAATALLAGLAAPAAAQERVVPPSAEALRMSFAPIVRRVTPAVVTVSAAKTVENRNPLMEDPFFRRFFGPGFGGPRDQQQRSLGSGVIVDPAGLVVTNHHVIDGADQIRILLGDKRELDVEIVLKDPRTDLAVLRIKDAREKFPALQFGNSDELQVGDVVLAIGNPFGVGQTVTQGIVSALARTQVGITDFQFFIQTDAAINPGNSGGPLVDMAGRIVGINTAIFSRSGGSQGVGFAIPANMVKLVVASARTGGTAVKRPWLGARLQALTPELSREFDLKRPAGAVVTAVTAGSPAARAGLRAGDVIVSVDGQSVDDPNAFDYRFTTRGLGGQAKVGIVRGGREMAAAVALETAPEGPRDELTIQSRSPFMGAKIANLSPALADELRLNAEATGVVIVDLPDGSLARNFGFQRGDVVLSVNNVKIAKTRDLERAAQAGSRVWRVTIQRGGQQISAVFGG
ncbi:MAG: Do family serine endopeptidase [Alphaproteobacteria bacterium]|nr:Do family serine endopeptidase [Alphaproteobacteria bacterium]